MIDKRHFALIHTYCKVLAETSNGIWYEDHGRRIAEVFIEDEGWASFSCDTAEEFALLCE